MGFSLNGAENNYAVLIKTENAFRWDPFTIIGISVVVYAQNVPLFYDIINGNLFLS